MNPNLLHPSWYLHYRNPTGWYLVVTIALTLTCLSGSGLFGQQADSKIELLNTPQGHVLAFRGLRESDRKWLANSSQQEDALTAIRKRFPVHRSVENTSGDQLEGEYYFGLSDGVLRFTPSRPFSKGVSYYARYLDSDSAMAELSFSIPARASNPARVLSVFPRLDRLPINVNQIQIQFSAPMRTEDFPKHILIEDSNGAQVPIRFTGESQLRWADDNRWLTIPLRTAEKVQGDSDGQTESQLYQFEVNQSYVLKILATAKDAGGNALPQTVLHKFQTVEADQEPPNPRRWRMHMPNGGSLDPMRIQLEEHYNVRMLLEGLRIRNWAGNKFMKRVDFDEKANEILVYAREPWWPGVYYLQVDRQLSDVSGNPIRSYRTEDQDNSADFIELEFEID